MIERADRCAPKYRGKYVRTLGRITSVEAVPALNRWMHDAPERVAVSIVRAAISCDPDAETFDAVDDQALQIGWEGDRGTIYVFPLMIYDSMSSPEIGLVWKQNNNGSTFVASWCRLPRLERLSCEWIGPDGPVHRGI